MIGSPSLIAARTRSQRSFGILKVWREGFLSTIKPKKTISGRVKWFSIPPTGEHVLYERDAGFEKLISVKPLELFLEECVLGPPIVTDQVRQKRRMSSAGLPPLPPTPSAASVALPEAAACGERGKAPAAAPSKASEGVTFI